jgi:predicted DNA-binding antitoxin AbrB/MazE fold protein
MTRRRISRSLVSRTAASAWLGCCLQIVAPQRALAQGAEASAADVAAARTLAVEGVKLAQAGKCDEAVDKLERAEKLHHAPIVLSALGECKVAQGKFVEGTEMLRKVLREPLPDHPSPAQLKAYEHAQATLDAAAPKIGRLTISVGAQGEAQPSVTVDGEPVPTALLGAERPTDPGEHVVEATAAGYLKPSAKVTLSEGDKKSVKLELERDPAAATAAAKQDAASPAAEDGAPAGAAAAAAQTSTESRDAASSSTHSGPNRTAAYVSWIAGGAALAVGAGFGIAAMSGKSDLDKQCNGNVCPPAAQDKLDSAQRNGTIATVAFGVGAAGLALGTVLFFTAGGSSETQTVTASRPHRRASGPKLQASLGLGNIRLAGEF